MRKKSFFQKSYIKELVVIFIMTGLMNSCSILAPLEVFWDTLLFMDTVAESYNADDNKISIFIDNKTDETLVVRGVGFDGQSVGAELIRVSKHKGIELRVTKGRKINIIGGKTGIQYIETECDADSELITVY